MDGRTAPRRIRAKFANTHNEEFRLWLRDLLAHLPMSLNSVEAQADIRGNALGKFLRGERGGTQGLTPLHIRRLAPVIGVSEEVLMARAGHTTNMPDAISVESAILADSDLEYEDKKFLIGFYKRLRDEG